MHRWSKLFIPTLREAPADAEVASHKLLLRAGYIRQLSAGIYSFLPLGQRSLNKIVAIVREEMDKIGQEFLLPALNPRELWEESGRYAVMGDNMFHLQDRKGAELVLAMTHEEVMTSIARNELRSYKQLPQTWYQIQTKFRDEPRPKGGLLRVRQFLMKDSYSFDIDTASLDRSYDQHDAAYRAIFTRCGLDFVAVEADSGAMGGSGSQEFMVYTDAGEDLIASSRDEAGNVVYAANLEKATSRLTPVEDLAPTPGGGLAGLPELVSTPGKASIADVTAFFGIQSSQDIKCVAFMGEPTPKSGAPSSATASSSLMAGSGEPLRPIIAFLRGDHTVNETKLNAIAGTADLRPMTPEELALHIGGPAGFLGPIGLTQIMTNGSLNGLKSGKAIDKLKGVLRDDPTPGASEPTLRSIVVLDLGLEGRSNLVAGANQLDFHYRNVTPARDIAQTLTADIRNINEGEPDPIHGAPLRLGKAVEIGHIFKLGNKYTDSMGVRVLNTDGKEVTPLMGCYGIGIERILTAAIESSAAKFASTSTTTDLSSRPEAASFAAVAERPAGLPATASDQYVLNPAIAPFEVIVTITNVREPDLLAAGERIAADLSAAHIDVLLDDRDERAGVKFKDAELTGIPFRINVGKKLSEGLVELVNRLSETTTDIPAADITTHLKSLLKTSNS
jgi:prolyl-tRNA synthetase